MTYPRSTLIDSEHPGFYHLVSRCVRRAWLCGVDKLTSRSYEHRRQWIEDRIVHLSEIFAVEVFAYSVMSNHYHLLIRLDPQAPQAWSDETVARRWVSITPSQDLAQTEVKVRSLLQDNARLAKCRERLGSVSWYMRFLNENIARRANREEDCTGRFWEGRYRSFALLDESAVLSAMVYVDLNPIRAGVSKRALQSRFTSIARRTTKDSRQRLQGVVSGLPEHHHALPFSETAYGELVEWTARYAKPGAGLTPPDSGDISWLTAVAAHACRDRRAFGPAARLRSLAARLGQRWVKGCGETTRTFRALSTYPILRTVSSREFVTAAIT